MSQLQPARRLPEWVLGLRSNRRANVALAVDVADAVNALGTAGVPEPVRAQLVAIIERAEHAGDGIPVSIAAKVLNLTEPTVRTWIERGALTAVEHSRPLTVTPRSLGEALAASTTIRRIGQDERLLRRLLDVLEDQRTRLDLADRIDELDARVRIDPDRIDDQLFGGRTSRSA